MGRLVQQAPPARTDRQLASRRGGSALLCPGRGTGLGRLTQAKPPPKNPARFNLVDLAQLRWRIERDYQDLKQEVGLGHYEGRGWRGFHHHATLCIAAYGFLIAERARFSPLRPSRAGGFEAPRLSEGYRPRGAADPTRTARAELDRHRATTAHRGAGPEPASMPVLRTHKSEQSQPTRLRSPLVPQ